MQMRLTLTALALGCTMALATGCEKSRDELRPDMDKIVDGDHGPQSRDLREMASRLAPDVLAAPVIAQNPNRAIIVMDHMIPMSPELQGQDMDIYLAKLTGMLNRPQTADRIVFLEDRATMDGLLARERGTNAPPSPNQLSAQFALHGKVYKQNSGKTSYYYFQFTLTDLDSRIQYWNGSYEVRTLN